MDYLFIFKNGGWWLKIQDVEQLLDYHKQANKKWNKAITTLIHSKEFSKNGNCHVDNLGYAIGLYGSNRKLDALSSIVFFRQQIVNDQINCIFKYGSIYVNEVGGYHYEDTEENHDGYIKKKECIFPDYSQEDIKIERFTGGTHFYAYVGEVQVKNGDKIKWNTYEEAMEEAKRFCQ